MLRQLLAYRNLLFILLLLNSGCLFLTDNKEAGLPYLRELYLLGIMATSALLLVAWKRLYQSKTSLWILFFGVALPLASAGLAKLNFGQPLIYGLLEERRSFAFLVFFPTLLLLIKTAPSQQQLEKFFLYSGLACTAVGYLYYLGIIPVNTNIAFEVDAKDFGPLRPDRYRIGSAYIGLCAFMLMYRLKQRVSLAALGLLLYFSAYLWLVLQTRQSMLIWVLAGLWIFRDRVDSLLKVGLLGSALLVVSYLLFPEFYYQQYLKFNALLFEATSGPGVRSTTAAIALEAVAENWYIGLGALSLQWNGGFSSLYNPHFYLSDVGIFGVYYRFGLLTPAIALVYYLGFLRLMKKCPDKGHLLNAFQLSFVFSLLNFAMSNALMYGGSTLGVAAASFLYYAKLQIPARSINRNRGWMNHDKLQHRHYKLE